MKRSNILKVVAIAASSLFLTGCPLDEPRHLRDHYTTAAWTVTTIDADSYPDPAFREYVLTHIDLNKDGILDSGEVYDTITIDVSYLEITDLTGIEYFRELKGLNCAGNNLKKLDISVFKRMEALTCSGNPLKDLRISGNAYLRVLHTEDTLIRSLDVSEQQGLTDLVIDKDVEVTGAEREGLKVVLMTRKPHPEWETDPR